MLVQHRAVQRLPVALHERSVRLSHVVALHRHRVRLAGLGHDAEGVKQVGDAVGKGIAGIVGEDVEQLFAGNLAGTDHGRRREDIVDVDDAQSRTWVEQQQRHWRRFELLLEPAGDGRRGAREGPRDPGPRLDAGPDRRERLKPALRGVQLLFDELTRSLGERLACEKALETGDVLLFDEALHSGEDEPVRANLFANADGQLVVLVRVQSRRRKALAAKGRPSPRVLNSINRRSPLSWKMRGRLYLVTP